jgi:hypothetical protein
VRSILVLGLVALSACSESIGDPGSTSDAGTTIDGGDDSDASLVRTVEVGTGTDDFVPIATDEQMTQILGPQGGGRYMGYHIWSAIKVTGFQPRMATVRFQILDEDRNELARQQRTLNLMPSMGAYVAYGVAPWLDDCCVVRNRPLIMHAEIVDSTGATGMDERTVLGGPICPDSDRVTDICP